MRTCIINFHAIFNTNYGQQLYIVGNHKELGQWNHLKSLKLITQTQSYPKWKSSRKIRVHQNYLLEFKVCIYENNRFKCWEHYHPTHENRKFKADCRSITLLIIQNNQSLIEEKRFTNYSSKELNPLPVRKFTTQVEDELEDQSSSSSSGFGDYYQIKQTVKPEGICQYNINSLVTTFKFIINQGWVKSRLAPEKSEIIKKVNPDQYHMISKNALFYLNSQMIVNNSNKSPHKITCVDLRYQNSEDWIEKTQNFCKRISLDQFYPSKQNNHQNIKVFFGYTFSLVPKYLKKFSEANPYKIVLYFDNLYDLVNQSLILDHSLLLESIFMVDCLQFSNYALLDDFIYFIEQYGIHVHLQSASDENLLLLCNMKVVVIKIEKLMIDENDCQFKDTISYLQLRQRVYKIEKNLGNLMFEYQKFKNNRIIVFNFGLYENFQILVKNKDLLLKLAKDNMIYVFTCNRLQNYRTIMESFSHIVFISHTYLEIAYNKKIYYLLNKHTIQNEQKDFISILEEEILMYPSFNLSIRENMIYITSEINNKHAFECLQYFYEYLKEQINTFNEEKQKNLTIKRINKSTIQISKEYQTEFFFLNLIFKNLETPPQFLTVLLLDRLANFKFQEELRHAIEEKQSHYLNNINYFSYDINKVQNHYNNTLLNHLNSTELTELLNRMSNASIMAKKQSQSKNLAGNLKKSDKPKLFH